MVSAKLSGRDYDFQEPILRREQLVKSEDLREELQGEPERSQPEESKDHAEARADLGRLCTHTHLSHAHSSAHSALTAYTSHILLRVTHTHGSSS